MVTLFPLTATPSAALPDRRSWALNVPDGRIEATSNCMSRVWAFARPAASAARQNGRVSLNISILFGFDGETVVTLFQRGVQKNFFDGQPEQPRGPKSQRQARIELT